MDTTQIAFLKILNDFYNDTKTNCSQDIDWELICKYAIEQQLGAIVYYQCKENKVVTAKLRSVYIMQICQQVKRQNSKERFDGILSSVPHLYFKGDVIAKQYKLPVLRPMCDLDVLIKPEDFDRAVELLEENNAKAGPERMSYVLEEQLYEIHSNLIHDYEEHRRYAKYFSSAWDYAEGSQLNDNYHFLYVVTHLKNHMVGSGIGFRQFLDIAVLSKNDKLDWNWIIIEAQKIGLDEFIRTVLGMNNRWFESETPIETPEISDSFYQKATDQIFGNGVFGGKRSENCNNNISILMSSNGGNYYKAKLTYILSRCFPSYDILIKDPTYKYIEGKRWLTGIAWIHRAVNSLLSKKDRAAFSKSVKISKNDVEKDSDFLRQWGL